VRAATIDVSAWPLVRIGLYSVTPQLVDAFLTQLAEIAERGPFVTVADARASSAPDANLRRQLFAGLQRIHDRGNWLAEAIVMDNPILRGIVTAYSWVRSVKAPLAVFSTVESAERWAIEHLPEDRRAAM
jgi:hypothetical protein